MIGELMSAVMAGAIALGAHWIADAFPWAAFAVGIASVVAALALLGSRDVGLRPPISRSPIIRNGLGGDLLLDLGNLARMGFELSARAESRAMAQTVGHSA